MSSVSSVETSTSTSTTTSGSSTDSTQTLGKDEFLQLLITKLQNQDPLKPMDDEDFIAQLAQFSTLEQMTNIAEGIAEANQWDYLQMQSLNNAMAAGLVGKDVQATYDTLCVNDNNTPGIAFSVSSYAATVEFTIKDADGTVVATLVEEEVSPGTHTLSWDGKDEFGERVPEGDYTIEAVAYDASGDTITSDLTVEGTIEAVIYRDGSAYLLVNGVEIALGDITAIGEKGAFDDD